MLNYVIIIAEATVLGTVTNNNKKNHFIKQNIRLNCAGRSPEISTKWKLNGGPYASIPKFIIQH